MHILLIRHGESENNAILHHNKDISDEDFTTKKVANPGLTYKGCVQAKKTGVFLSQALCGRKVDVYCSRLNRASRTAEIAMPYQVTWALETGAISKDHTLSCLDEWDKHGDEKIEVVRGRIDELLNFLYNCELENPDRVIVLFGHSLLFSLLLSRIMSEDPFSRPASIDKTRVSEIGYVPCESIVHIPVELPNCSISNIYINPKTKRISVYQLGKTDHLGTSATAVHTVY